MSSQDIERIHETLYPMTVSLVAVLDAGVRIGGGNLEEHTMPLLAGLDDGPEQLINYGRNLLVVPCDKPGQ